MRLRLLLAALLAVLGLTTFAQDSKTVFRQPSDQQRIADLERKVSTLQDRVLKLEQANELHFKRLTQ